jgi:hypothetical protein
MRLVELAAEGIRGLPDGTWSLRDGAGLAQQVVFVTGKAGAGKTRWLEAAIVMKEVVGSTGPTPDSTAWRTRRAGGRLEATWALSEAEAKEAELDTLEHTVQWEPEHRAPPRVHRRLSKHFSRFERGDLRLEYFPANRQWGGGRARVPLDSPLAPRMRQSRLPEKYEGLPEVLLAMTQFDDWSLSARVRADGLVFAGAERDGLDAYRAAVAGVVEDLRLVDVRTVNGEPTFGFVRRGGRDDEEICLAEITEAERQAALFAMWSTWLGIQDGVIIVDGPEHFIRTSLRRRFFDAILALWPTCQVLVATDAAELWASRPGASFVDLDLDLEFEERTKAARRG